MFARGHDECFGGALVGRVRTQIRAVVCKQATGCTAEKIRQVWSLVHVCPALAVLLNPAG